MKPLFQIGLTTLLCGLAYCAQVHAVAPAGKDLPPEVQTSDYVLLGEVHDNREGHALRLEWLRELAGKKRWALALEQLDREHQDALDQAINQGPRSPDSAHAVALAGGFNFKGWKWPLYEPVLTLALEQHWHLVATNLSRAQLAEVIRGTRSPSAPPAEWSALQQEALLQEVKEGHCNLLPESQLPQFVAAQQTRDHAMAEAMVAAHHATGLPVILLAGNGHLRKDLAVPVWLHALDPGSKVTTVAVLERNAEGSPDQKNHFDQVIWVNPEERPDPCVQLRKQMEERKNRESGAGTSGR